MPIPPARPIPAARIPDAEIDRFIQEDVPYIDLTTHVLQIGDVPGRMEYFTREACTLCASEEAARVAEKLGCEVVEMQPSGTSLEAGETFFALEGTAENLHAAWKVCLNLFDHLSSVSTKTRGMVDAAHAANPRCEVRAINPHVTVIAAGGVNPSNVAAYAATGVDGIVTTSPFTAKPIDMSVRMSRR